MTESPLNQVSPLTVSELDLGSPKGRPRLPIEGEIVRSLHDGDLGAIQSPPAGLEQVGLSVGKLRNSHHRLAELIAAGILPMQEVALVSGYSPCYISSLKGDPAFAELVAYYEHQKKSIFIDSMERLKTIGLDAMEKLQERLNDETKPWSNKELMDLVDMAAVQPNLGKNQAPPAQALPGAFSLEVKFIGAEPKSDGAMIEGKFTDVTPK